MWTSCLTRFHVFGGELAAETAPLLGEGHFLEALGASLGLGVFHNATACAPLHKFYLL